MTKARPQVLALNRGEVDLEAIARSDLDSYASSAQVMENAHPAVKGGMFRSPGTCFIGEALGGPGFLTLVRPWRFSRRQAFTLEVSHEALRIVYGTGYIQTGPGDGSFGAWVDASTGGATISTVDPDWQPGPEDPDAPPGGGGGSPGSGGQGGGDPDPPPGHGAEEP